MKLMASVFNISDVLTIGKVRDNIPEEITEYEIRYTKTNEEEGIVGFVGKKKHFMGMVEKYSELDDVLMFEIYKK